MGCCGEARDSHPVPQNNNGGQGTLYPPQYPTSTQPGPHPPIGYNEKPHYDTSGAPTSMSSHSPHKDANFQQHPMTNGRPGTSSPPATGDFNPSYPPGPAPQGPPGQSYTPMLDPNIVRPSPVHAANRSQTVSPPLAMGMPGQFSGPGSMSSAMPRGTAQNAPRVDDGKLSISVEYVLAFERVFMGSGCAYLYLAVSVQRLPAWPTAPPE